MVRSGVAQASSSPGRCACGLPGNRRYIRAPVAGGVDRSAGLRDQALHDEHCRPSAPPLRSATGFEHWCEWVSWNWPGETRPRRRRTWCHGRTGCSGRDREAAEPRAVAGILMTHSRCDPLTIQGCHRSLARCKPRRRQLNLFPLLEAFLRGFHQRPESGSRDHFGDNLGHPFGMVEMDPVSAVAHDQMSPA